MMDTFVQHLLIWAVQINIAVHWKNNLYNTWFRGFAKLKNSKNPKQTWIEFTQPTHPH